MTYTAYDSNADVIGEAAGLDDVVKGDGLGRTLKKIALDNEGWIEDARGEIVWDVDGDVEDEDDA